LLSDGSRGKIVRLSSEMWALNLATYNWFKVIVDGHAQHGTPVPRAYGALSAPGRNEGFSKMMALVGGATYECNRSTPCSVPQPSNDVWTLDVAPAVTREVSCPAAWLTCSRQSEYPVPRD
jgi:hypothetical protein